MSVDHENPPEVLGILGASAALSISDIPFDGPIGATRVSHEDGVYSLNPTYDTIDRGNLSVVVAGTRDGVMMVEAGSSEVSEDIVLESIRRAQDNNGIVIGMIDELVAAVGKPKRAFLQVNSHEDVEGEVKAILNGRLTEVIEAGKHKDDRDREQEQLEQEVQNSLGSQHSKEELAGAFESVLKKLMRGGS